MNNTEPYNQNDEKMQWSEDLNLAIFLIDYLIEKYEPSYKPQPILKTNQPTNHQIINNKQTPQHILELINEIQKKDNKAPIDDKTTFDDFDFDSF
ncbi:MAG: hypothetical protein EAZ55_03730 [Cytophagales bacterium]|nr:MAG: hypothetical protein EAZ55_03730 [Cytophagales bacterium]